MLASSTTVSATAVLQSKATRPTTDSATCPAAATRQRLAEETMFCPSGRTLLSPDLSRASLAAAMLPKAASLTTAPVVLLLGPTTRSTPQPLLLPSVLLPARLRVSLMLVLSMAVSRIAALETSALGMYRD